MDAASLLCITHKMLLWGTDKQSLSTIRSMKIAVNFQEFCVYLAMSS